MARSVLHQYQEAFAKALGEQTGLGPDEIRRQLKPAEPPHGDLAFAAFPLSKVRKAAPAAIAADLADRLRVEHMEIRSAGPYVNATFLAEPFTRDVLGEVTAQGERYGNSDAAAGKTVVIDFSSPNIAKPIAFHHIRSTVIGHALSNLYRSQGWRVVGINYLGDWGKQFGLVAVGFREYGDLALKGDMGHLVNVYVKANERADKDPEFDAQARGFFRRMEENDPDALTLWKEFRETSIADFRRIYERLGIHFDAYEGESRYQGKMDAVIEEIGRTVGTRESLGALVVDMPYGENEPPVLLRKADGSTLYATRDLAAAIDRHERFRFDRSLYVVATDQSLHFRQVFAVLERMGHAWAKSCMHVNFGRVHGMSTRRGQVVLLNDVLDEAKARALEKVSENQKAGRIQTDDPNALAESIGLGAIVFGDLKNRRTSDYTFDWEEVLNFDGHTGPYLQYAHARACNVLGKAGRLPGPPDPSRLVLPEEQSLVRQIARFPQSIDEALQYDDPSSVSRLMIEVATAFSRWYTLGNQDRSKRILVDGDDSLREARLGLTTAVRTTLKCGLQLLGLRAPESM